MTLSFVILAFLVHRKEIDEVESAIIGLIGSIVVAIISLIGVIITNSSSNAKVEAQLKVSQAVTDTKIENLTTEVKKHNSFAERIPVIEEKIKAINIRIEGLEEK